MREQKRSDRIRPLIFLFLFLCGLRKARENGPDPSRAARSQAGARTTGKLRREKRKRTALASKTPNAICFFFSFALLFFARPTKEKKSDCSQQLLLPFFFRSPSPLPRPSPSSAPFRMVREEPSQCVLSCRFQLFLADGERRDVSVERETET